MTCLRNFERLFLGIGSLLSGWQGLMVLLEFDRGQVVEALVRAHGVVVPAPCLDLNQLETMAERRQLPAPIDAP